jgi:O-acetyl-ADP-ribose deacetylase (regulator of RNase III)
MTQQNLFPQIKIIKGDITTINVDAIVNAANSSLMGGGGVDGAIHQAGGPAILEACKKFVAKGGGCKTGQAVITTAGQLSAKFVIHTVGPVWRGGNNEEAKSLSECYKNSLELALANNCSSIAFPSISTGIYGFPKAEAAEVALAAVVNFLSKHEGLTEIIFVCFDDENHKILKSKFRSL